MWGIKWPSQTPIIAKNCSLSKYRAIDNSICAQIADKLLNAQLRLINIVSESTFARGDDAAIFQHQLPHKPEYLDTVHSSHFPILGIGVWILDLADRPVPQFF
jgi:hypothetical protein